MCFVLEVPIAAFVCEQMKVRNEFANQCITAGWATLNKLIHDHQINGEIGKITSFISPVYETQVIEMHIYLCQD